MKYRSEVMSVILIVFVLAIVAVIFSPTSAAPPSGHPTSELVGTVNPNGYNQHLIHEITIKGHDYLVLIPGERGAGMTLIHAESCSCRK